MMMKEYLIIALSTLILTSCSTNESDNDIPSIHDSISLDIDEDGITDYNINYSGIDIDPFTPTGGVYGISGSIQPNGANELLRHSEEGLLFLRNLEEIKDIVSDPLEWNDRFSNTIVTIATKNVEGEWPSNWKILSARKHSTYFVGLKLVTDSKNQLGWVEIEINRSSGSATIVDKGIL